MIQAIVGGTWGDEGKGKMTDLLAERADIVVRYQGGANAGHTIINEYGKFVQHLLPCGVFRQGVINVIAQGVALNLAQLFAELDMLAARGVPPPNIRVSDRAQLVMPYHMLFDRLEEERLGERQFGSTRAGIAPFYADKYLKTGIQVADLFDQPTLGQKVRAACEYKNQMLQCIYHAQAIDPESIITQFTQYCDRLRPLVCDTALFLNQAHRQDKRILLEGQLGALKDPDNGIYPFCTSSSPLAGFASVGAGIPPHAIGEIVTVVKAYSSCVGAGAFVSEIFGDEAEQLRRLGGDCGEYGATTGRPRRMGWFDAVAVRYGCMLQGTTKIALSLMDALGYLDEIPVCAAYEIDGRQTTDFPVTPLLNRAKPVLRTLPGWERDIRHIRCYADLPDNARRYVDYVEEAAGYPVAYISNGPRRDDIIVR